MIDDPLQVYGGPGLLLRECGVDGFRAGPASQPAMHGGSSVKCRHGGRASLAIVEETSPMSLSKRLGKYRPVLRPVLSAAVEVLMLSCRTDCINSPLTI